MHDQLSIDELNLSLCQLQSLSDNSTVWLAGDFNAPSINWEKMCFRNNHVYASTHNSLLATTCDYGLTQLVTASTRLDNTLDLFFTDHPSQITDIKVLPGMSDHDIVMITADIEPKFTVHLPRKFYYTIKLTGMLSDKAFLPLQLILHNYLSRIN